MSDEPTFDFKPWEDLSVGVRRNRKKMYEYMVSVLNGETPGPTPPGPTPTTGTVTATVTDLEDNPQENAMVIIDITDTPNPETALGMGITDNTGVCTIMELDKSGDEPAPSQTVAQIPYGTYYAIGMLDGSGASDYVQLTVDSAVEEVIIKINAE